MRSLAWFVEVEVWCHTIISIRASGFVSLEPTIQVPRQRKVESNISVINYEKDQYRRKLSHLNLEDALHAKQFD